MISLIKYNLKIIVNVNYLIGWIFMICIPMFFDMHNLNENEVIKISEYVFTFIGVIWFAELFSYERRCKVEEVINQRSEHRNSIFVIRVLFILASILIGIAILLIYSQICDSEFSFSKILYSSVVNSFMFGMIALVFSQLVKQVIVGYMMAFVYYYMEFITKGSLTGNLHLFGMIYCIPYNKVLLMLAGIILLVINFTIFKKNYNFK